MEVVPGVYLLGLGFRGQIANGYIWIGEEGPVVIDTGPPGAHRRILAYLSRLGYRPQDVVALLVTHGDWDHMGSLAALKQATEAPVVVPEREVPLVTGRVDHATRVRADLPGARLRRWVYGVFTRFIRVAEPVQPDVVLSPDADEAPGGLRPVPTPGHTAGHTSYYDPQRAVVFTGDAILNLRRLSTPAAMFTEDMAQARASVKRLALLRFDVACFGHGPPIVERADEAIRRFADRLNGAVGG